VKWMPSHERNSDGSELSVESGVPQNAAMSKWYGPAPPPQNAANGVFPKPAHPKQKIQCTKRTKHVGP
jgi:hypothetical protein